MARTTRSKVDAYIDRSTKWPEVMTRLRPILAGCGLTEEIKWGKPCFSQDGHNIVIFQEMKEFLALMFFKGALLSDPDGILEQQGPNSCLLYTSDAADDLLCVDLGGRRIIKNKTII